MNQQTDLSKKLRAHCSGHAGLATNTDNKMLLDAADEIERYYTGMMNWKATAEAKDKDKALATPPVASGALEYVAQAAPIAITDSSALNGIKWYVPPPEHLRNGMQLYFVAPKPVAAAAAPNAALVAALTTLLRLIDEFGIESGVCCCGDDMERHGNPMDCGHSPVDSGEYYSESAIEAARAALAQAGAA